MWVFILALFLLGSVFIWLAGRRQAGTGLPRGRVVYVDTQKFKHVERPLYDPITELTGRPDYVVDVGDGLVPVEVKSGHSPLSPYPSHIFQLAAYCLLVQAAYGTRPQYGMIRYADRTFAVDYDSKLENNLLDVLAEMRRSEKRAPDRSHESAQRCLACGYRGVCDQRLD